MFLGDLLRKSVQNSSLGLRRSEKYGFNAETEEYGDMLAMGVVDPTKVTRYALQNAASIAGLLLTTEALISEIPEQEKEAPQMPGGGGMGGF